MVEQEKPFDPYEPRPTLWQRHPNLGWILAVFGFTVFLTYVSFPPVSTGEVNPAR